MIRWLITNLKFPKWRAIFLSIPFLFIFIGAIGIFIYGHTNLDFEISFYVYSVLYGTIGVMVSAGLILWSDSLK
jgi:hypothetical protein